MKKTEYYIGLMSGTSIDGVDVALVEFKENYCQLINHYLYPIESLLTQKLHEFCDSIIDSHIGKKTFDKNAIQIFGELDQQMGLVFASAVNQSLKQWHITKRQVIAIGSHGQTVFHQPNLVSNYPFSLQIGDPNLIAYHTGITTVADFRRMDIAAGGQGAPLAPAFHQSVMHNKQENRIILNLGGIANITLLPANKKQNVIGFDTGPANTLLDSHFKKSHPNSSYNFDLDSKFAQQGQVNSRLLNILLSDDYFTLAYPKSTGREHFCLDWLDLHLAKLSNPIKPESIQATLVALTVKSIANSINQLKLSDYNVYTCGGGMHNQFLLDQLSEQLGKNIFRTNDLGINGDYLEAMTFAWLACQRINKKQGNLPSVTGSKTYQILGGIYQP